MADDLKNNDIDNIDTSNSVENNSREDINESFLTKKRIIFIAIPIAVLLLGIIMLYLFGVSGEGKEEKKSEEPTPTEETAHPTETTEDPTGGQQQNILDGIQKEIFLDLPDIIVNLNSDNKKQAYLKSIITLALPTAKSSAMVEANMPRIIDSFQVYLRELSAKEVQGSAGMFRLKEELIERINRIISPEKINDILFKEMLIQ